MREVRGLHRLPGAVHEEALVVRITAGRLAVLPDRVDILGQAGRDARAPHLDPGALHGALVLRDRLEVGGPGLELRDPRVDLFPGVLQRLELGRGLIREGEAVELLIELRGPSVDLRAVGAKLVHRAQSVEILRIHCSVSPS